MEFQGDIKKLAKRNSDFRRVIVTGKRSQLVVMSIPPREDIGSEVHPGTDQIFLVARGKAQTVVNGRTSEVEENDVLFVPAGTEHNIINMEDDEDLKIVTVYAPPQHAVGTVHKSKIDAMAAEGHEVKTASPVHATTP